jgi:hypothetical protein
LDRQQAGEIRLVLLYPSTSRGGGNGYYKNLIAGRKIRDKNPIGMSR